MSALNLLRARTDLIQHARPSLSYVKSQCIDWASAEMACGGIFMVPAQAVPPQSFRIDPAGSEAAIVEVYDEYGLTVDLVCWRPADPSRWRCLIGAAPALGRVKAVDPATYVFDEPLKLYKTPLRWLQQRCYGAALLDPDRGARWLLNVAPPAIAAEDEAHAAAIHAARQRLVTASPILLPERPLASLEVA